AALCARVASCCKRPFAAQWGGLFAAATVACSVVRQGPRGGPQGGVAIVAPHPMRLCSSRELVLGCTVLAEVALSDGDERVLLLSLYLSTDSRREVIDALEALPDMVGRPLYIAGDINMQLAGPRDDGEHDDTQRLLRLLTGWAVCPAGSTRPTRRANLAAPHLDVVAAPSVDSWRWDVHTHWHLGLSDHAL
ncbi:MAG: hypothetical protein ACKPKO_02270, partial [Candidatus Fonsibacter sp.]